MTQLQAIRKAEGMEVTRKDYKSGSAKQRLDRALKAAERIGLDKQAVWPQWLR